MRAHNQRSTVRSELTPGMERVTGQYRRMDNQALQFKGTGYNTSETLRIACGWSWPAKRHYLRQAYNRILSL